MSLLEPEGVYYDNRVTQENRNNLEYVGPLYLGSHREEADIVWDTGSDALVIKSYTCSNCDAWTYNHGNSADYVGPGSSASIEYGSGHAYGYYATDTVCN